MFGHNYCSFCWNRVKMDFRVTQIVAIYFIVTCCTSEGTTVKIKCDRYELLKCGDGSHKWMFCRPGTPGYKIANVRLDIRFPNGDCLHYNTPINFYLLVSGETMWTTNYCFGSFLLCLQKVDPSTSRPSYSSTMVTEAIHIAQTTNKTSVRAVDATAELLQQDDCCQMKFRTKFWLLFGVVAGGVTMIGLIAFITYITIYWESETTAVHAKYRVNKNKTKPRNKYFRGEKHSTSTLLPTELDSDNSVYACIPVARTQSNVNYENERENRPCVSKVKKGLTPAVSLVSNGTYDARPFSVIKAEVKNSEIELESPDKYKHVVPENGVMEENEYDHLKRQHVPRKSVSDINTYNHLCLGKTSIILEQSEIL